MAHRKKHSSYQNDPPQHWKIAKTTCTRAHIPYNSNVDESWLFAVTLVVLWVTKRVANPQYVCFSYSENSADILGLISHTGEKEMPGWNLGKGANVGRHWRHFLKTSCSWVTGSWILMGDYRLRWHLCCGYNGPFHN